MKTYWFEIVLNSHPQDGRDLAEEVYGAGCDDCLVSECEGVSNVAFAREADSLEMAIATAIAQLESHGCVIEKIEIDELDSLRIVA